MAFETIPELFWGDAPEGINCKKNYKVFFNTIQLEITSLSTRVTSDRF